MKETSTFSSNQQQQMMSLTQDLAILNENLREIEEAFNKSQEISSSKKAKPVQYGQFQFIFNKP